MGKQGGVINHSIGKQGARWTILWQVGDKERHLTRFAFRLNTSLPSKTQNNSEPGASLRISNEVLPMDTSRGVNRQTSFPGVISLRDPDGEVAVTLVSKHGMMAESMEVGPKTVPKPEAAMPTFKYGISDNERMRSREHTTRSGDHFSTRTKIR